jgi:hypothetical protein
MDERRLVAAAMFTFVLHAHVAQAESESGELALQVARICYLEATFREADCIMIWHVARKRAAADSSMQLEQVTTAQVVAMLSDYSAIRARNPRAEEVRGYLDATVASKGKRWNAQWATLRTLARELCDGRHPDPCPAARHWGGTMDPPRGGMVPARCAAATANTFYAVRR